MAKNTVADIEVKGKKVLMRVDFNVPLEGEKITERMSHNPLRELCGSVSALPFLRAVGGDFRRFSRDAQAFEQKVAKEAELVFGRTWRCGCTPRSRPGKTSRWSARSKKP